MEARTRRGPGLLSRHAVLGISLTTWSCHPKIDHMTTNTNTTTAEVHAKRRHEAPELGKASQRFMRALVRRSAEGDTEALEALVGLQAVLQEAITDAGRALHDDAGYSFTELAQVLGISRQGARQRFTTPERCPHGRTGVQACVPCNEAGLATLLDEVTA